jgi:hypothetical protein
MFGLHRSRLAVVCTGILVAAMGMLAPTPAQAGSESPASTGAGTATKDCRQVVPFVRDDFPDRPKIDNRFLPLLPGTNTVMSGTVLGDDGRLHKHKILSTVSRVTKVLDGIRTLVLFERDFQDGQLQEPELAFEAQDKKGTLWNVGEYPEQYENGKLLGADSTWIAGIDHARAGVNMLAHPRVDTPAYLQGVSASVDFRDCAKVTQKSERVCVPVRCFNDVLVTDEWAPLDPEGGHQTKYYAPGVGSIRVGAVGGTNQEVLELTSLTHLGRAALDKIDAAVMKQDRRGYRVSPDVYGHTRHAELGG